MPARNISVTYGNYTVNGSGGLLPTGQWRIDEEDERATFEFEFVIQAGSASALATAETAAVNAFRTPRGNLTASLGGGNRINWSHANSTGYDAQPYIRKIQSEWSSAVSAHYVAGVRVGRPADRLNLGYRRNSSVSVSRTPSQGSLTISGSYSAGGGSSASANYAATPGGISTYASSVLTAVGGNWELIDEQTDRNETDKELTFQRRYREVLANQAPDGAPVSTHVFEQQFSISVGLALPGDAVGGLSAVRPRDVSVSWRGTLGATVVNANPGSGQITFNTLLEQILPWIHARVVERIGPEPYALQSETIERSPDLRGLTIQMRILAPRSPGTIEYERRAVVQLETGEVLIPRWSTNKYARFRAKGPGKAMLVVEDRMLTVGGYVPATSEQEIAVRLGTDVGQVPLQLQGADTLVLLSATESVSANTVGEGAYSLLLSDASRSATYEMVFLGAVVTAGGGTGQEGAP